VLLNVGLKMTINYSLVEFASVLLSGGLRKTTNCFLAKVVSILPSGGLRKTTNQSGSFWDDHKPNHVDGYDAGLLVLAQLI
jgi:hypothetical protein